MIKRFCICFLVFFFLFPNLASSQVKLIDTHFKRERIQIPPHKFLLQKFPPIRFKPFELLDFRLRSGQDMIQLKNGKMLRADQFLKEVNEIEKKLNECGYTLRDKRPVKIQFSYPKDKLMLQREIFQKGKNSLGIHPQIPCEDTLSHEDVGGTERPKDFVPFHWEGKWDASFGNGDFGVKLVSNMKIEGREPSLDIQPFSIAEVSLFGSHIDLLGIEKKENFLIVKILEKKEIKYTLSTQWKDKELLNEPFDWSTEIGFPIGPIEVIGKIGLTGRVRMIVDHQETHSPLREEGSFSPHLWAKVFGRLETGFKIVDAGINGEILIIENNTLLAGSVELMKSSNRYFRLLASGRNKATLLKGWLIAYAEIDYLLGSKRFEVELFNFDGIEFDQPLFNVSSSIPAEKDHHLWMKINHIRGVTPFTARNEKLEIVPKQFELIVDIGGRRYVKELKDFNGDGHYGNVLGENEVVEYEVPLLSFKKIPIRIEVVENYRIGAFEFKDTLDFTQGSGKSVELCYDPRTRTFTGTMSGREEEEIRSVGDSSYWGERPHLIIFELSTKVFGSAPAKAR